MLSDYKRRQIAHWIESVTSYSVSWALKKSSPQLWAIKCDIEERLGTKMPPDFQLERYSIYVASTSMPDNSRVVQGVLF